MSGSILVTGGAGYIGSHVVKQLVATGERVIVLDNLSTGFAHVVQDAELVIGDSGDRDLVSELLSRHKIEGVLHFAAHTIVPESVRDPLKYYGNNTCNSRNLLACCQNAGVKYFIFSSTAAVYGMLKDGIATETSALAPINPYGMSKLMTEWMLRDLSAASSLRHVVLRYFNVAGSDPNGRIGQLTPQATLLIKVAAEVAVGKRPYLELYGTDYDTPDGTCIRDFIHVEDLADAHVHALGYLRDGGVSQTLNCGYGRGYSVRQVIDAVNRVSGKQLPVVIRERRAGDSPMLIANAEKLKNLFSWQPRYDDLDFIVKTSLDWERQLLAKNNSSEK